MDEFLNLYCSSGNILLCWLGKFYPLKILGNMCFLGCVTAFTQEILYFSLFNIITGLLWYDETMKKKNLIKAWKKRLIPLFRKNCKHCILFCKNAHLSDSRHSIVKAAVLYRQGQMWLFPISEIFCFTEPNNCAL